MNTASTVSIVARLSVIVADAIVVAVTWKKTFHSARMASQLGMGSNLSATLFRDGEFLEILTENNLMGDV